MNARGRTPAVVGVAVIRPYVMRLLFNDGLVRDLQYVPGEAHGSLLLPLDDPAYLAQVRVDDEARTIVWPNGLKLPPEVLHGDYVPDHGLGFHDITAARQPRLTLLGESRAR